MVVKNEYKNIIIPNPTKPVFIVTTDDGKSKVLNDVGEEIFTEYNNVEAIEIEGTITELPYEKSVLKYEENGKYGLIDFAGNAITGAIYDELSSVKYKEGEILAKRNGKYGVINNKGKELIDFEYDEIEADKYYTDNGYSKSGYIVKTTTDDGYRYGYISSNWKTVLDTEYTSISRILEIESNDIYLIVARNGQYGVLRNQNVIIDFAYQSIAYNKDAELFKVERSGQFGVLDIEGNNVLDVIYKTINFNGEYILAQTYTEDIYFNKNGEKLENTYTAMIKVPDLNYNITVNNENLYGIIDEAGNEKVKNEYLYIEYAFEDYFVAYKSGEGLGVIDKNGNVCIDFKYDVLSKIGEHNLLKGVDMENNVTDVFSGNMQMVISLANASLDIKQDYIEIYNEEKTSYITPNGEVKTAKDIFTNNTLFAVCKDGKWGFEDKEGNEKVQCTYDYVTEFNRFGFAGVKKDGLWGVIDEEGNIVCECKFNFESEGEIIKPEFLGKYYKTYSENNVIYYSDETEEM